MIPDAPPPGAELAPARPSDETLRLLAERRSGNAKAMTGPGPTPEQADALLRLAARVPDHRMIAPFRFVVFEGEARARFGERLRAAKAAAEPGADEAALAEAAGLFLRAPLVIAVVSSPDTDHKTPVWEQELTAGAACQNLLIAAAALGYAAQWLTGWPAYDESVRSALALEPAERVAGYFYLGTSTADVPERPRPDMDAIVTRWT